MQFYLDLLAGSTTLQDLSDEQLAKIRYCWKDDKNVVHPEFELWVGIRAEIGHRESLVKSKIMKRINKDFYNVK